jgi:hypothetical protein
VRAAHDLKLVKLKPKNSAGMFNKSPDAKSSGRCTRVFGSIEVPDFNFSVVGAGYDPLTVEPDASNELLVALENS